MLGHPVKVNVLDVLRNVKLVIQVIKLYLCYKWTEMKMLMDRLKTDTQTDGITSISKAT